MRALALVVVLALSAPVRAADDAPLASSPTPTADLCLTPAEQVTLAKRLEADKARIAALEAAPAPLHPLVVVGLVVLGVVVGGAAGYGIAKAAKPAP